MEGVGNYNQGTQWWRGGWEGFLWRQLGFSCSLEGEQGVALLQGLLQGVALQC